MIIVQEVGNEVLLGLETELYVERKHINEDWNGNKCKYMDRDSKLSLFILDNPIS